MPRSQGENAPKIAQGSFVGGAAIDPKLGIAGAMGDAEAMDFRQKASQMSVLPGARALTSGLSDLPTVCVQTPDGVRYMLGDAGHVYRVSTSNVVSDIGQLTSAGAAGLVYNQQSDQLYIAGQQTVTMYGQIGSNPGFKFDQFGPSASVANGVVNLFDSITSSYDLPRNNAASVAGGITLQNYAGKVTNTLSNTYTVRSAISETIGDFCPFIPDIEPFHSVPVWVTAVGSGDLTLTMHDSLNNNLGAVTIAHANLKVGWNNFVFAVSGGIRAIPNAFATGNAAGYHFHLTSSVSPDTMTVATYTSGDLTGCNFLLFAHRLVQTNNGWHPMAIFGQYLVIGNGPYLSTYNFANDGGPNNGQWVRHQLSLDYGYEVCGLSVNNNMLVIAAEKRSTNASRSYQDGYLYFWDGANVNFNSKIEVPMGAPYGVKSFNNITYFLCAGSLFAYGGGQSLIKVRYIGYQNTDYLGAADSTIVNPNMMDVRYGLLLLAYPSSTTVTTLKHGVYSWGSVELTYPNSFGYSYALSNAATDGKYYATASNHLQIGMIANFVDTLYTSWKWTDGNGVTHYGLDVVDNTSAPAPVFSAQNLIWDGGVRWKMKRGLRIKINFLPLPTGTTLTVNYTLDRGTIQSASTPAAAGDTSAVIEVDANFYEIAWGFVGANDATNTQAATITGWACEVDTLDLAQDLRPDDIPVGASLEAY